MGHTTERFFQDRSPGATGPVAGPAYAFIGKQQRKGPAMTTIQRKDILPAWTPGTAIGQPEAFAVGFEDKREPKNGAVVSAVRISPFTGRKAEGLKAATVASA
jgi:hypothetical protein